MNIYDKKYAEFDKMSKHELIEYILDLTPFALAKNNKIEVLEDGSIITGIKFDKLSVKDLD